MYKLIYFELKRIISNIKSIGSLQVQKYQILDLIFLKFAETDLKRRNHCAWGIENKSPVLNLFNTSIYEPYQQSLATINQLLHFGMNVVFK